MASIQKQIKDLKQDINDIIAGYYTQPTSLGPNTLSKNSVKARSIRSGNIDVSNLESVQTKTGSLTVDGNLTIGTGGSLRSGKTSYSDVSNAGFWIGIDSAIPKIRVGNIGHTSGWTWDGTTLAISGTVTATSGTIGGWTIGSTDLTADGGATGIASSGSYRIWTGDANPANAEFSVTSAGALKSTSGTIGGWTINGISGFYLGSGASQRGIDTGSTTFYAGSSTPSAAPFNVSSSGVLNATGATITGNITASSLSISGTASFAGGSMLLPNGGSITASNVDLNQGTLDNMSIDGTLTIGGSGKIQWAGGNSYIDSNSMTLTIGSTFGSIFSMVRPGYSNVIALQGAVPSVSQSQLSMFVQPSSGFGLYEASVNVNAGGSDGATTFDLFAYNSSGLMKANITGRGDGTLTLGAGANMIIEIGGTIKANIDNTVFYPRGIIQNDQIASSGASGTLPSPTKYWVVKSGVGINYYVPLYSSQSPWTA